MLSDMTASTILPTSTDVNDAVRRIAPWVTIQPYKRGGYDWTALDEGVGTAARAGLRVLPVLYGTPRWLGKQTTLPIDSFSIARLAPLRLTPLRLTPVRTGTS